MNWRSFSRTCLLFLAFFIFVLVPSAQAQNSGYVEQIAYQLEQPIGGVSKIQNAAQYIQLVYQFALGIVGLFAVVLIMFGGMQWVTAAGNEQKITSAKEIITSALAGLIIALLSYTILLFVNPTLVNITLDVSKIDIQQNDDSIYNLPKCSNNKFDDGKTSAANFKDNICIGEDKKDIPCPDIACGHLGFFDGEYCRGDRCESGDGGCYPDPLTPASALSCQLDDCGRWVQDCMTEAKYKKFMIGSSDTKETATRDCVCSYYSMKLLPQVPSIPANYDYGTWGTTYAAAEAAIYKTMGDLCEEKIAGSDWRLNTGVEAAWNCKLGQPAGSTDPIAYEGSGFNCQLATRDAISSSYIASYNIFSIFSQKINTFCYAP